MRNTLQFPQTSRRQFLRWGALALALLTGGGLTRFMTANTGTMREKVLAVGPPEDYLQGKIFPVKQGEAFIGRDAKGLYALDGRCTHLGCRVEWNGDQGEFACPCHGSRYDSGGRVLQGRATRPLRAVALKLDARGELVVDLRSPVPADHRLVL